MEGDPAERYFPLLSKLKGEFMKWTNSDGKRLKGLVRRRKAEVELYYS